MSSSARSLISQALRDCRCSLSTCAFCLVGLFCIALPLSIPQLVFAIAATIAYALLQEFRCPRTASRGKGVSAKRASFNACQEAHKVVRMQPRRFGSSELGLSVGTLHRQQSPEPSGNRLQTIGTHARRNTYDREVAHAAHPPLSEFLRELASAEDCCQAQQPTIACDACNPTRGDGAPRSAFDNEVCDLLALISPSPASERMVRELARSVQQTIRTTLPEAHVVGFSSGDLACSCTLGMGDPEVDLVVSVNPDALPGQLKGRLTRCGVASLGSLDARKVQKSAIRACTDRLVSVGGFKFRRSAFRGQEPKVTLLAPVSFTAPFAPIHKRENTANGDEVPVVPVDLSVNTTTSVHTDAVLQACGRLDPRAKALIVLVRRWARDRGICLAAKGHLSPYAWSLLTAFFLQVAPEGDTPVLPCLEGVQSGSAGAVIQPAPPNTGLPAWTTKAAGAHFRSSVGEKSVGSLFAEFVNFYHNDFNWRSEAVSIRVGRRAAPDMAMQLHIIVSSTGVPEQVGPHIQDPFEPRCNLGTSMTVEGFTRMREELARAAQILTRESPEPSLEEIMAPWVVQNACLDAEGDTESISASHRTSEVSVPSQLDRHS